MSIGKFLRKCRMQSGLNQSELAFELNLNQSDVSKFENDMKEPPTSIFKDWTITTQSVEMGIAFLYGTEILTTVPEIMNSVVNTVAGFITILGGAI